MVPSKTFCNANIFSLEFFLLLKTFSRILYRANFTITGRGLLPDFLFFPILCVLSKSAINASSFSSCLDNFKTLSSVLSFFSSFNPWIKMQLLLDYSSCLSIFLSRSSTFIVTLFNSFWRVAIIASFSCPSLSYSSNFLGYKFNTFCQIS